MNTEPSALLHLMRLVSPALPVGAYVYSQGLETAVNQGWVHNADSAEQWLRGILAIGVGRLEAPVFLRLFDAWDQNDVDAVTKWNQFLQASRETSELLLEDTQMGAALMRLLKDLKVGQAQIENFTSPTSFVTAFALAAHHWQIEKNLALQGLLWSWLENQVAAAIKLVPLGQTQGQQLLLKLTPAVQNAAANAQSIDDADIGWSLPRLAMASMLHEHQYSRLFRS